MCSALIMREVDVILLVAGSPAVDVILSAAGGTAAAAILSAVGNEAAVATLSAVRGNGRDVQNLVKKAIINTPVGMTAGTTVDITLLPIPMRE
ncbi:MAG: hypothetical protein A2X34_08655 [Elusimicrobia bacterium GWC2_51_8]|nr:MAG: hypothetical protein A2X33_08000 [Elusimicrobia bacterium GWA2_51_34]OGR58125.1 MAG: hypothetical protein A2X34_08655 [Elusimicrobia bacterium GWC2_51_8]HAF95096.1 hypothetical protein [Elusimicrobiota bacterium]HCE98615.1 hypothetical protein [Elusimicrobiota bacterium]